jgi:hypothetical protein
MRKFMAVMLTGLALAMVFSVASCAVTPPAGAVMLASASGATRGGGRQSPVREPRMGSRLLGLAQQLVLGAWSVGAASASGGSLGAGPLGTPRPWLGLVLRALGIAAYKASPSAEEHGGVMSPTGLQASLPRALTKPGMNPGAWPRHGAVQHPQRRAVTGCRHLSANFVTCRPTPTAMCWSST